jgi:hypothetical protein
VGSFQEATKASADSSYEVRLALDTGDAVGTSGTYPWSTVRFGIKTPEGVLCVDGAEALLDSYTTSHHNCDDVLTIESGNIRYVIENPDSAVNIIDTETYERPASLSIYVDDVLSAGPLRLDTATCHETSSGDGLCRSGGPC